MRIRQNAFWFDSRPSYPAIAVEANPWICGHSFIRTRHGRRNLAFAENGSWNTGAAGVGGT